MDNNFILNQYNGRKCMRDCTNCPFFSKVGYPSYNPMFVFDYGKQSDDFLRQLPQTIFWQDSNNICNTRYEWWQDYLLEYCRKNYPWVMPIYIEVDYGKVVRIPDINTYEKQIKEIFKKAIDIAAEATKDKNPRLSIMFDGIGFVLADDVKEAVKKVFSILDKTRKIEELK